MNNHAPKRKWNVFCDFDGTISAVDVTDSLLEAFAEPEWRMIEAEWLAGRIGSRDCMRRQVELLRCSHAQRDAHAAGIGVDPDFRAFAAYCAEHDIPLAVVSDGIDEVIRLILRRHSLEHLPLYANQLVVLGPDRHSLAFPNAQDGCGAGTCKCGIMRNHHEKRHPRLLIGDGASDFCAAEHAGFVLAKGALARHCREKGIPHAEFTHFGDVLRILPEL